MLTLDLFAGVQLSVEQINKRHFLKYAIQFNTAEDFQISIKFSKIKGFWPSQSGMNLTRMRTNNNPWNYIILQYILQQFSNNKYTWSSEGAWTGALIVCDTLGGVETEVEVEGEDGCCGDIACCPGVLTVDDADCNKKN